MLHTFQISSVLRTNIQNTECEQQRLLDAFNGLELFASAGKPQHAMIDNAQAYWSEDLLQCLYIHDILRSQSPYLKYASSSYSTWGGWDAAR